MNHWMMLLGTSLILLGLSCRQSAPTVETYQSFEEYPIYDGKDLGLRYSPGRSVFKIWSPPAAEARIHIYEEGLGGEPLETVPMERKAKGLWEVVFEKDLKGKFYAFQVNIDGEWLHEVPDPYVRAVGVNGKRGMVD